MKNSVNPVWVVVDQDDGRILSVSFQLIAHARKLADKLGVNVEAVLLGNNISDQCKKLFAAGADRIYLGETPELILYQSELYTEIIVHAAIDRHPQIILFGSTPTGRELAPLVAAKLETGLTAHCMDLIINDEGIMEQKIPAYGGLMTIVCPEKRPQMATVAQGVFPNPDMSHQKEGEIIPIEIPNGHPRLVETLEVVREVDDGVRLESASIVVAGGAGANDIKGWNQIADLAVTLNAALGCTRPVVDEGWADLDIMIGQSGKMVSPEVYIGIGLSGELQHMVGILGAKLMIAVNIDPKAPIFHQVDYGIVDDCKEFIPILLKKLKHYRENLKM